MLWVLLLTKALLLGEVSAARHGIATVTPNPAIHSKFGGELHLGTPSANSDAIESRETDPVSAYYNRAYHLEPVSNSSSAYVSLGDSFYKTFDANGQPAVVRLVPLAEEKRDGSVLVSWSITILGGTELSGSLSVATALGLAGVAVVAGVLAGAWFYFTGKSGSGEEQAGTRRATVGRRWGKRDSEDFYYCFNDADGFSSNLIQADQSKTEQLVEAILNDMTDDNNAGQVAGLDLYDENNEFSSAHYGVATQGGLYCDFDD